MNCVICGELEHRDRDGMLERCWEVLERFELQLQPVYLRELSL